MDKELKGIANIFGLEKFEIVIFLSAFFACAMIITAALINRNDLQSNYIAMQMEVLTHVGADTEYGGTCTDLGKFKCGLLEIQSEQDLEDERRKLDAMLR